MSAPGPGEVHEALEELGELPERPRLPLPRWLAPVALLCLVGLVPWIVLLAIDLPRHARAEHYNLAWVGFDIGMWLAIAALAWSAWRRRPWTGTLAAVTATLLVVDAWFDVVTALRQRAADGRGAVGRARRTTPGGDLRVGRGERRTHPRPGLPALPPPVAAGARHRRGGRRR